MSIFGSRSKNNNSEIWRDSSGKIRCLGDNCPKDCDDSCPIYLNTQAAAFMQFGMGIKALPLFEKIIKMAPDFYDPWNNMGSIYGSQGNYSKAHECYSKAHEIAPSRPAPVLGLALTSRDLKRYDECVKWCNEYDKLTSDHQLDNVRRTAIAALR